MRKYNRRGKRAGGSKSKGKKALVKTIKSVLNKKLELKTQDVVYNTEQALSPIFSNNASYINEITNIPQFAAGTASLQDGRVGTKLDIRRFVWCGRFKIVTNLDTQLRLRVIVVRWANNGGDEPSVTRIVTSGAVANQAYMQPTAPDCPYQILADRRYVFEPNFNLGAGQQMHYFVRLDIKTPKDESRIVEYSQTALTGTYSSVQRGLIRVYWMSDGDITDSAYTSCVAQFNRVYFTDG